MNYQLLFGFLILGLLVIGFASAYIFISPEDNLEVVQFKWNVNKMAIEHDLQQGVNQEAIKIKLKYFYPGE